MPPNLTPEVVAWVEREHTLLAAAALLALLLNIRVLRRLLYPLALLSTWAHECAHGLAALLAGGRVERLYIYADGSGLATTRVPSSRLRRVFVASAGYTGTAALGSGLLALRHTVRSDLLLIALGSAVVLSVLLWVRNAFGALALAMLGAGLILAGVKLPHDLTPLALTGIGGAISLNALTSLRHLYGRGGTVGGQPMPSDAETVAAELWLPAWCWATLWLAGSLAMVVAAIAWGG